MTTTDAAYPYLTTLVLYHPTGSGTAATAKLKCGWHENCDEITGDPLIGLDWTWTNGNHYSRFRVKANSADTTLPFMAARADAVYDDLDIGCPRVDILLMRTIDDAYYGDAQHAHTSGGWSGNLDITSGGGSFVKTDVYVGPMVNPAFDNCNTEDWHTMQSYFSGPVEYDVNRNASNLQGGLPDENTCNWWVTTCPAPYAPWSTYEYAVRFYAY